MGLFKKFIDESEIEEWFEDEKEKLDKIFYKSSYARKGVEKAKSKYEEKMRKLITRYNLEFKLLEKRRERKKNFQKPFIAVRDAWRRWIKNAKKKWKARREKFKKWRFNREYKHLMKK